MGLQVLCGRRAVSCTWQASLVEILDQGVRLTGAYPLNKDQPAALLGAPPLASLTGHGGPPLLTEGAGGTS